MTTTIDLNEEKLTAFIDRAFTDLAACYGGVMVSLGDRLGLYRALDGAGPLTSAELAERAGCAERYVREWLGSQVAAAYLEYDPATETYELPAEHAAVLADPDSPTLLTPAWNVPASMWIDEEQAAQAFRTGEGVPWGAHPDRLFCGVASFYRNAYRGALVPQWLPALDGVVEQAGARGEGGRHRLRPRPLGGADGRGVPELDVRRHRPARGLDRRCDRERGRGRCLRPGEILGGHRHRLRGAGL